MPAITQRKATVSPKILIGQMLLQAKLIGEFQLHEALSEQRDKGGKILEILMHKGYLDVPSFVHFLASDMGFPSVDVSNIDVSPEILDLVPADFARRHEIFPLDRIKNHLTVGMVCPTNSDAVVELEALTGLQVKTFVCPKDDLLAAIHQYYGDKPSIEPKPVALSSTKAKRKPRESDVERLIRKIDVLPALPATARHCQEAPLNQDSTIREYVSTIMQDPCMAANLLRVVNSAKFGLSHSISNIASAVSFLGIKETYALMSAASVQKHFELSVWFDRANFRRGSLYTATACKALIEAKDTNCSSFSFAAGLLHDLGRVVLALVAPDRYPEIHASCSEQELVAAEEMAIGIAHPEAGYILAKNWGLPSELTDAIRFHAYPENASESREVVEVVALAAKTWSSHSLGLEDLAEFTDRNVPQVTTIGLEKERFISIMCGAKEVIERFECVESTNKFAFS